MVTDTNTPRMALLLKMPYFYCHEGTVKRPPKCHGLAVAYMGRSRLSASCQGAEYARARENCHP